jgi:hypothetical protein
VVGFVQRRVTHNRHRLSVWAMPTRGLGDRRQRFGYSPPVPAAPGKSRGSSGPPCLSMKQGDIDGAVVSGNCVGFRIFFGKAHFLPSRSSQPEASGLRRNERRVTQATGHGVCVGIADKRSWSPLSDFSDGILHLGHPESSGCPPAASRSGWHDNAFLLRRRRCTPQPRGRAAAQRPSAPRVVSAAAGLPQRSFTWGRLQTHWGCATPSA